MEGYNVDNDTCISVSHVTKRFGKKAALQDVTFDISFGEFFGLLGPSGAGKTTLVKMIGGIDEVTEGSISVLHTKMPNLKMMNKIGFMAQSDALYNELTAFENIDFFATIYGLKGKAKQQRIDNVLELVNLLPEKKKPVHQFSGGMKRRLSLAIAIVHEPEVLLLDEPTVGIDPILRQSIWDELRRLKDNGKTIIVTTHVMDEAEKCSRLGMIREGCLIGLGTPEELKAQTSANTLEEAFLTFGGVRG
ncbi:ABC transporter ATP-binding protein [Cytobacillus sp. Hm23]